MLLKDFGKTPSEWAELSREQRAYLEAAWYEHNRRRNEANES